MLTDYFAQYVQTTRSVTERTAKHYIQALNTINDLLSKYEPSLGDLFTITSIDELKTIEAFLSRNSEFQRKDAIGHRMYSVAFRHYQRFVSWYFQ